MPQGQYPQILAGTTITASLLNSMLVLDAYKAVDTSRSTTTTLTADPDLAITVAAAGTYDFEGYLNFEGAASGTGDLQFEITSVGTLRYVCVHNDPSTGNQISATTQGGGIVTCSTATAGTLRSANMKGDLIAASTGTLTLLWAQNTSSATATILHAGSWIKLRRKA